jgi:hypothetical protein
MKASSTVKVMFNQWGNYVAYVRNVRALETDEEWKAQQWLNDQASQGAKVSDKSYLQVTSK